MFRKLVSNLAFSPALVGQLSFYAKRLKKEEATRKLGLVFTVLALLVQSFAVFTPPQAANAASGRDLIYGGVSSMQEYLAYYDRNERGLKDIITYIGITREELAAVSSKQLFTIGNSIGWGRLAITSEANGERVHNANGTIVHSHPIASLYRRGEASRDYGYIGYSAKIGWFAITPACGNVLTKTVPVPPAPTPMCTVPGKTHLPANDPNCKADPVATCTGLTVTRLADNNYQFTASGATANGANITGYAFVPSRNGTAIGTLESTTNSVTTTLEPGTYSVRTTLRTSLGDRTSNDCVKEFTVPEPTRCPVNPDLLEKDPRCQPCPGDSTIWLEDEKCEASIISTKTAENTSQGNKNASDVVARSSDKIVYTLNVENKGLAPTEVEMVEDLADVLEYSKIIDNGGGTEGVNSETGTKTLSWPKFTLAPGEKQTRIFTVQVLSSIPAVGQGASDPASYDCKMVNNFGNSVEIAVDCPAPKVIVEQTVSELPHTGPAENMIFAGAVLSLVAFFYARARQMKKEVRLIRRELNAGTI